MSNTPALKDEVERKAIETIEKLALDRAGDRITEAQYSYGLDILWSAVAGLAGEDFTLMMEVARNPKRDSSFCTRKYFLSIGNKVVRVTNTLTGVVEVVATLGLNSSRKIIDLREERNPSKAGKEKFDSVCAGLTAQGYKEI